MLTRRFLAPFVLAAGMFAAPQARALTGTQTTSTTPFSKTGSGLVTAPITFPRFDPSLLPATYQNVVLTGYQFVIPSLVFGGTVSLANGSPSPITGTFLSDFTITFDGLTTGTVGFTSVSVPIVVPGGILAGNAAAAPYALNTTVTNLVSSVIAIASPGSFTSPPATPLPQSDSFDVDWAYISPSAGDVLSAFGNAQADGSIGVRWSYTYDEVPGPLPLLGTGAAFAWSRRLRRRAQSRK